ncbi:hypothetical protein H0H87_009777 [Tephrocybe sp. NHM501043]|nr:hypothetical protein H0H87_009777 [Tephrocybe sp. NHM501043]
MPSPSPDNQAYGDDDEESFETLPHQIDRQGGIPDVSPLLVELTSEEFPSHFTERDGRLFHSHDTSPYPLPADTPEQQRLNVIHAVLCRLIGANYVGPVSEVLAPSPGRQKLVLDLCTGTGKWVLDMAREFPDVLFRGLDIVPIATRYPPTNVQFEVHDVSSPYRWRTASIDLVHARSISMAVRDYAVVLREVGRILRPGGLFISYEWGRYPAFHPDFHPSLHLNPAEHTPGVCHFFDTLIRALDECRGIRPIAGTIPALLGESGAFRDVTQRCYYMPIGPWHPDPQMKHLGRAFRAALVRYADSVKPLLVENGLTEEQVGAIVHEYVHELKTVRGMVSVLYTVHAHRI